MQVKNTLLCYIPVWPILLYPLIVLIYMDPGFLWIELIILLSGNDLTHACWRLLILQGMYWGDASVCTCSGLSFLWCEEG